MKTYEITIKPQSSFGTPLKGDTIFGCFCWQIAYDSTKEGALDELLSDYHKSPFVVFSSAYPKYFSQKKYHYALKTPDIPMDLLFDFSNYDKVEKIRKRKDYKSKKWMVIKENEGINNLKELPKLNSEELFLQIASNINNETKKQIKKSGTNSFLIEATQFHNKINRLTGKTGVEGFAPYSIEQNTFLPNLELALFVGFDEDRISLTQILNTLEKIGQTGFGKDASLGLGKFQVGEETEIDLKTMGHQSPNAIYTLSPFVPEKEAYSHIYFTPFTRFGKHGDILSKSQNPFKNPVIMADEGAIAIPKDNKIFEKPFVGKSLINLSKVNEKTVSQGYSLYIPVYLEG